LVIAEWLLCAALNATLSEPLEARVTFNAVGAVGAPTVTGLTGEDAGPTISPLSASMVNVYDSPFVNPDITVVVPIPGTKVDGWATPFKNGVTMYPAMHPAGVDVAGNQLTVADALPGAELGDVGADSEDAQS
jgi:hypothetical protein